MLNPELKAAISAEALELASKLRSEYAHMNQEFATDLEALANELYNEYLFLAEALVPEVPLQELTTSREELAHELYEEYLFLSLPPLPRLGEWARYYAEPRR